MTLKEKFLNSPCEKGYVNTNVYRAENNVKIADDYAIEFLIYEHKAFECKIMNYEYAKAMLENFKKEKGL